MVWPGGMLAISGWEGGALVSWFITVYTTFELHYNNLQMPSVSQIIISGSVMSAACVP